MGGKRQVQSGRLDKPPAARSSCSFLFARGEIDSPFRGWFCLQASSEENDELGRGRFWLLRSYEWDRRQEGKAGRPFDAKWILEKVFVPRAGGYVCSRAVRLVFPILFCPLRIHNAQVAVWFHVPPRDHSSGSLFVRISTAVTKRSLLFRSSESGV